MSDFQAIMPEQANIHSASLIAQARARLPANQGLRMEGDRQQAGVLVAITVGANEPAVIMTERAQHMKLHPGESAFPGGKKDPEDASLLATALREAYEEVGLLPEDFEYLGCLDQQLTRTHIEVAPFVGLVPEAAELTANLNELGCIYTIPLSFLLNPDNLRIAEVAYQGEMRKVPHFDYLQHSVWGVTAIILVDLLNTAFGAKLRY